MRAWSIRRMRPNGTTDAVIAVKAVLPALVAVVLAATATGAEIGKPGARDSAKVQSCIKSARGGPQRQERCIGIIADPCLNRPQAQSTAGQVACADRELAVWDDILNETFRRLNDKLDEEQKIRLRDMQRAWIESRDRTCAFYWDFYQGTMAHPMRAFCANRETARRAMFLLRFLVEAEDR
jgi:uncharacterized protein YecT (DUF1311 family)